MLSFNNAKEIVEKFSYLSSENGFPAFYGFPKNGNRHFEILANIKRSLGGKPKNQCYFDQDATDYIIMVYDSDSNLSTGLSGNNLESWLKSKGIEFDIKPYLD